MTLGTGQDRIITTANSLPITSSRIGAYFGLYGIFLSPIPIDFHREIIAFRAMFQRPRKAQEIPTERTVMAFVLYIIVPFEIMPNRAIKIAMGGDSPFPIAFSIFSRTVLKVLAHFQNHTGETLAVFEAESADGMV